MYDDFDLDYTCEDNSFNYDDEFYEDLDENYQWAHTDYQELAYTHYAWYVCTHLALDLCNIRHIYVWCIVVSNFKILWHQKSSGCVSVVELSQQDLTGIITEDYRYYIQAGGVAKFVQ